MLFSEITKYGCIALSLREFLRSHISLEDTVGILAHRISQRDNNFLSLIRQGIYQSPSSPYLKLLKIAGCEYQDIEKMVRTEGIESALMKLRKDGVYLSWEEFKGLKKVIRSGQILQFKDSDFDNPLSANYYYIQSSGTRSSGTKISLDLNHRVEESYYHLLMLSANNALEYPIVMWKPVPPSASGIGNLLIHWKAGKPIDRWFSPVDENQAKASLKHRLALRYIIFCGKLFGANLVSPEHIVLQDAWKVALWIESAKKRAGGCSLNASVSPAVMVAEAAIKHGIDIQGTRFFVSGEPLTDAKRCRIEAAGGLVIPRYSISEIGRIGIGCANHKLTDEVHLLHDSVALIQHVRKVDHIDLNVDAFLFTSLLPTAPKILLNVESDDYGVLEKRECGCLLGKIGFTWHINNIRSFAKLTGSGMTVMGTELVRTLEVTLPEKFGGGPTDYQLVEQEDENGKTTLYLIVSPDVGNVDESALITTILNEMRKNVSGGKLAAALWNQSETIQIKRTYPLSKAGKVLTLHLKKLIGY